MGEPGSSVGIATKYGLDGLGIESRWGHNFLPFQISPGAHPASCTMGTGSLLGVNCGWGVPLTTHPLPAPRSWNSRAIPLAPLGHNQACNGVTLPLPLTEVWTSLCSEYHVFHFPWFILLVVFSSCVNSYHYSVKSLLLALIDISICLSYHMM
jgi:hypothetical protein